MNSLVLNNHSIIFPDGTKQTTSAIDPAWGNISGNLSAQSDLYDTIRYSGVPVGTVACFYTARVPSGWIECTSRVSADTYPDLAKVVPSTIVSAGWINLEDLRGVFLRSKTVSETAGVRTIVAVGSGSSKIDSVGLLVCIKAYGEVANEGLMDASQLSNDIEKLRNSITTSIKQYADPKFTDVNTRFTGVNNQFDDVKTQLSSKSNTNHTHNSINNGGYKLAVNSNGTTTFNGTMKSNYIQSTSDIRKKYDITKHNISGLLDGIGPNKYKIVDTDGLYHIGVIAQDVQKTIPEAVGTDEEGFLSVDYNALVAVLIGEVNSLKKRIRVLENK